MLTKEDFLLIKDQKFLIEKRGALLRVTQLLNEVEVEIKKSPALTSSILPENTLIKSGKISQGENYKGLPYLVLDYPRYSNGNQVFIYRTMFWWGHYFMCVLISENCGHQLNINSNLVGYHLNIGETPWNYDLSDSVWVKPGDTYSKPAQLPFICMSKKIEFDDFNQLSQISRTTFETLTSFLVNYN